VERRLAVEDHVVSISDVSLNFVANLDMSVRPVLEESEVDLLLVMPDDVLGAGPVLRTILDQSLHLVIIRVSDCLGKGEIGGNLIGDTKLIELEAGIWSDDGSRGEVNSLSHQVASQSSFLSLESRSESSQSFA